MRAQHTSHSSAVVSFLLGALLFNLGVIKFPTLACFEVAAFIWVYRGAIFANESINSFLVPIQSDLKAKRFSYENLLFLSGVVLAIAVIVVVLLKTALFLLNFAIVLLPLCLPAYLYYPFSLNRMHFTEFSVDASGQPIYEELAKVVRTTTLQAQGASLTLHEAGPNDGPLIIFLHGFPETALICWKKQILYFSQLGFRVIAPDLRGFGASTIEDLATATVQVAVEDTQAIIKYAGRHKAIIVGHDVGAVVAWNLALKSPEAVEKLVVINGPHPSVFKRSLYSSSQLFRSLHMFFFLLPTLPEKRLVKDDFAYLARVFHDTAPLALSLQDIHRYKAAWRQPGVVASMLAWCRNFFLRPPRESSSKSASRNVTCPVMLVAGQNDPYVDIHLMPQSREYCPVNRLVGYETAGHWVQHDVPALLNRDIQEFLFSERVHPPHRPPPPHARQFSDPVAQHHDGGLLNPPAVASPRVNNGSPGPGSPPPRGPSPVAGSPPVPPLPPRGVSPLALNQPVIARQHSA